VNKSRIIVSLDFPDAKQAIEFCHKIDPINCKIKIGKELFTAEGPKLIEKLRALDFEIFLDLKYHDIPNTVANACRVAADLDVWMLNIHAAGGRNMMEAAYESLRKSRRSKNPPLLISISSDDLLELGITQSVEDQVLLLSKLAKSSGLDGVVCSGIEVSKLRRELGKDFCLVTPGIRLDDLNGDDQKRIMSPHNAIKAGSNYLVIGRPITGASNPTNILKSINKSISSLD
jgi:orotidine-5'-phosphate decarboxylase